MKYLFLLSEKFYRFIEWEWNTLKNLRRTKRKNFFLRGSFALFSLFSILFLIFLPPIAFGILLGEGLKFSIFFIWIWILNLKFFWKCLIYFLRLFNIKNIKIFDIKKSKNITLSHEPLNLADNKFLNICGHYHPKLYLKNNGDKLSLRCFAMDTNKNNLYLPAFGDLTGGYLCKKSFKKWAIISEEEIIEI